MRTVREIAMELGVSSDEVLARLTEMGTPAAGDTAPLEPRVAEHLRARMVASSPKSPPPPPPRPPGPDGDGARPWSNGAAPRAAHPVPPPPSAGTPAGAAASDAVAERPPWGSSGPPGGGGTDAPATGEGSESRGGRLMAQLAELPLLILLAFAIAVLIKTFLVQAFFIPSASMFPTLRRGDRVLVEKVTYRLRDPASKDVVVFAKSVFDGVEPDLPWYQDVRTFLRELLGLPTGTEQDYIKRIVAVGGDTLSYAGSPRQLSVNGEVVDEPYIRGTQDRFSPTLTGKDCRRLEMTARAGGCVVPAGEVFVMGDNRSNSEDSRAIGPIQEEKIVGHAFVIIWPPSDLSGL